MKRIFHRLIIIIITLELKKKDINRALNTQSDNIIINNSNIII